MGWCCVGKLVYCVTSLLKTFFVTIKLPRACSALGMFAQASTDNFYAIVRKNTASLLWRLRASSQLHFEDCGSKNTHTSYFILSCDIIYIVFLFIEVL